MSVITAMHITRLVRIRQYLTIHSATILGAAIVARKIDYCYSLFDVTTTTRISKLQRAQDKVWLKPFADCLARCIFYISTTLVTYQGSQ